MIAVISPAKSLDFDTPVPVQTASDPAFSEQADKVMRSLRRLSRPKLRNLMSLSPALADLNYQRNQQWIPEPDPEHTRQAVFAFNGDVYQGLEAENFTADDLAFATDHLRILSGLYGLLKPLDRIQPYRLEMGSRLKVGRRENLYAFWGDTLTESINRELESHDSPTLVNLASQEYFKAIRPNRLKGDLVHCEFKDAKNGTYKVISFFAKKARGAMAAFMIRERIQKPEELQAFDGLGYRYNPSMSKPGQWTFTREEA